MPSKQHLLFLAAGIAIGYFMCNSLITYPGFSTAYTTGQSFGKKAV